MDQLVFGLSRAVAETFDLPDPMMEIGSYQVEGQEAVSDLRPLFPGKEYIGVDMREGPGVDRVDNVECLSLADASVGTVIAMSLFEHVRHFWKGFDEIRRVLRPDGAFVVACPFFCRVHAFPSDYWRLTVEALKLMLAPYPSKIVGYHGTKHRPVHVWAVAFREGRDTITPDQHARFRDAVDRHAHQSLDLGTSLRYRLGRLLCGRRPFEPFLERNHWDCELLNAPA